MSDYQDIMAARLAEVFSNEPQEEVAQKLNTVQSNISKYVTGQQLPNADFLYRVSMLYNVSVDWLMGLSDEKEINGISYKNISYEQAVRVFDHFLEKNSVEVPNENRGVSEDSLRKSFIEDCEVIFGETPTDEKVDLYVERHLIEITPRFDTDNIRIRDRALSYLMRKRQMIKEVDEDLAKVWYETKLAQFKEYKLIDYVEGIKEKIDSMPLANYSEGDWLETLKDYSYNNENATDTMEDISYGND